MNRMDLAPEFVRFRVNPPPRTVVIVGAGFCGTVLAINLLRGAYGGPLRVMLVDRAQMGRGVAYASRGFPYLLNVPAGRMSARAAEPLEFLQFAQRHLPHACADDFLPRDLYGAYLEASLAAAEHTCAPQVELERVYGSALAIERRHPGPGLEVHLANGRTLSADAVVLACGNPPPAALPAARGLRASSRYVADPWATPPVIGAGETVLIVGTGLTMADVVLAGEAATHGGFSVHALSRRGLIPPSQSHTAARPHDDREVAALLRAASVSVLRLMRATRTLCAGIAERGGDWRDAITLVRTLAPQLWQRLTLRERRRFLRHVRPYWDLHRHRLPEGSRAALDRLGAAGTLQTHAGRLLALEAAGRQIRATWRVRGSAQVTALLVDRVINCTGPDYDAGRTREPVLRSLIAQGLASADCLGLGLATDELGALVGSQGRPAPDLFYLGPMLRPAHWETTAVPELREHAARLAQHLSGPREACCARSALPMPSHAAQLL